MTKIVSSFLLAMFTLIVAVFYFTTPVNAEPFGENDIDPTFVIEPNGLTLQQAADATYRMYMGNSFVCSGVFVKSTEKEDLFLTAAHCGTGKPLSVTLDNFNDKFKKISTQVFYLRPVRTLKRLDVMVFKTMDPSADWNVATIATQAEADKMTFGTSLFAIGYPMGKEITVTRGDFQNKVKPIPSKMDQEEPVFKVTVPVTGGSSGGGFWLETETGLKIVGLTSHGFRHVDFMNYAATTKSIHRVTRNLLK